MELEFTLFVVIKKFEEPYFRAGMIKGSWFKGSTVPRFQDVKKFDFKSYRKITKLAQVKNPEKFMNMKAWLELERAKFLQKNSVDKDFLYKMICDRLKIEKAFVHKLSSKIMEYYPRKEAVTWQTQ